MNNTIFTDYGIVKIPNFTENNIEEKSLDNYLNTLSNSINSESNIFLVYDKGEDKLYTYNDEYKSQLVLTRNLKSEFDNNLDTEFNKRIRELLKLSKEEERFNVIDKKRTFDNIEEADFYIKYLERFDEKNDLSSNQKIKLQGAREYIIKSNKRKIERLDYNKSMTEKAIKEHTTHKILYILLFNFVLVFSLLTIIVLFYTSLSMSLIACFSAMFGLLGGLLDISVLDKIKESDILIYNSKTDLNNIINEINNIKDNELIKENDKTKEETKTNTDEENIKNEIQKSYIEIYQILKNDILLDLEEENNFIKEALEIIKDYKDNYKLVKENKEDIQLTIDNEYSLQMKTYIKIQKLKNEINETIKTKMELNDFNQEIDELANLFNSSLNNNNQLVRKIK